MGMSTEMAGAVVGRIMMSMVGAAAADIISLWLIWLAELLCLLHLRQRSMNYIFYLRTAAGTLDTSAAPFFKLYLGILDFI